LIWPLTATVTNGLGEAGETTSSTRLFGGGGYPGIGVLPSVFSGSVRAAGSGSGLTRPRSRGGGFAPGRGGLPGVGLGLRPAPAPARAHSLSVAWGSSGPIPAPVNRPRTVTALPTAARSAALPSAARGVPNRHQIVYSFAADVFLSVTGSRKT